MKTKNLILSLFIIACGAVVGARAETSFAELEKKIELGLYRADATLLAEADTALTAALAAEPKSPALLYLRGFATYAHTSLDYRSKDMKAVGATLERADKELKAVKGAPWEAEAAGLRGMIAGQLIGVRGGASAMTLGPKMGELTTQAYEDLPESDRVRVFHAVKFLNTPAMFGGDKQQAMALFTSATARFEQAKPRAGELSWGRAFAWCWLAQARLQAGDVVGAKEAAEQALAVEPEYQQVKRALLPAIEKKLAAK